MAALFTSDDQRTVFGNCCVCGQMSGGSVVISRSRDVLDRLADAGR